MRNVHKPLLAGLALAAAMTLTSAAASAATTTYKCDPGHTEIRFSWEHAGFSTQSGEFDSFDCTLALDEDDLDKSTLTVTIKADSMQTGFADLDKDLKSENFFEVAKYPDIKFVSTKVDVRGKTKARVMGDLTMHGVTVPVTLEVTLTKKGEHPIGQFYDYYKGQWAGFRASADVKRSAWKLEKYAPITSDEVNIAIVTEMKAQ